MTHGVVPHNTLGGGHMAWSHVVWLMSLRACVHVTHDTWLNDSFRAMCQVRVKDMCQVVMKVGLELSS